jgi:predicted dehydrogenase
MHELRRRFGRPLRLGMIGGGPESWIGILHRGGAEMDGWWKVVAGTFSNDPARSKAAGVDMGFDAERSYGDIKEMIAREKARPDGIDAVAIMTPNDTHYPFAALALDADLDVVGEKPVTTNFAEARDLVARTRAHGRIFAVAHGFSAYPMTRHARALIRDGAIGDVRLIQVEYIQGGLSARVEDGPLNNKLKWVFDPQRSGLAQVMSAIGNHAQHLASTVTGRRVEKVVADVGMLVPNRKIVDYVSALLEFEGGVRGTYTVTQAASGGENDIRLRVYGEKGMIEWSHRELSYLKLSLRGEPVRIIGRGDPYLSAEITATGRTPRGHPEGMREAFANIYTEVAQRRMAIALGDAVGPATFPTIDEAAHTMAFIEACLASHAGKKWMDVAAI